jgi:hypothetical protein
MVVINPVVSGKNSPNVSNAIDAVLTSVLSR